MLLLSRKRGESIVIDGDIVVTIIALDRNRVQIGIQAPAQVPILRQEIIDRQAAKPDEAPVETRVEQLELVPAHSRGGRPRRGWRLVADALANFLARFGFRPHHSQRER